MSIFCPKCGTQLPDDAVACSSCGAPLGAAPQPAAQAAPVYTAPAAKAANGTRGLCMISYLGIFGLYALVLNKEDADIRFHVNQALCLNVFLIIATLFNIIPILGQIAFGIATIMYIVFTIMGILNAKNGVQKELPIVGKYRLF
ncbi:MAG: zinc-ribbon domain-containing protein [Clostridiales bacterium]|nr:zinc-ribbon domain-containing protein [Clostridiales bacterium]